MEVAVEPGEIDEETLAKARAKVAAAKARAKVAATKAKAKQAPKTQAKAGSKKRRSNRGARPHESLDAGRRITTSCRSSAVRTSS